MQNDSARDAALLLLRLCGLYLALGHGLGKVMALSTGAGQGVVDVVSALGFPLPTAFAWLLGLTELVGGLAIALGLYTRVAAAAAAVAMIVAAFAYHLAHLHLLTWLGLSVTSQEVLDSRGDPERAILYALIFLALALFGAGRFSVDATRSRSYRF